MTHDPDDISYTERFVLRVMTQEERSSFGLTNTYVWIYECGGSQLYLTTEEAMGFVDAIGQEVVDFFEKKFKKP